jgi:hypothetical protein
VTTRVLSAELRRGPLWALGITVTPVLLIVVPLIVNGPFGWAGLSQGTLGSEVQVTGVLTLAVAAWQGGRERRRGTRELLASTPRPAGHRALAAWLPTFAWPAAAYTLVTVIATALAAVAFGPARPAMVGLFAAAELEIAACAAVGFGLGRLMPGRFVAPLAGIAAFAGLLPLGNTADVHAARLVVLTPFDVWFWMQPVWWFAPAAAVWFGGLAIAALTVAGTRRRWYALFPLVVSLLAAVLIAGNPTWRVNTTALVRGCGPHAARHIAAAGIDAFGPGHVDPKLLKLADRCHDPLTRAPQGGE